MKLSAVLVIEVGLEDPDSGGVLPPSDAVRDAVHVGLAKRMTDWIQEGSLQARDGTFLRITACASAVEIASAEGGRPTAVVIRGDAGLGRVASAVREILQLYRRVESGETGVYAADGVPTLTAVVVPVQLLERLFDRST